MRVLIFFFTILVVITGCMFQPQSKVVEKPDVVVFAIDRTGSYNLTTQAMNMAANLLVKSAQPGDLFFFRYISDQSYADAEAIFTLKLPAITSVTANPFDPKARRQLKSDHKKINQLKDVAASRLRNKTPNQAPNTDIYGAVIKASEIFSDYDTGTYSSKIFIMATDLKDNLNRPGKMDLTGVKVVILMFESDVNPQATQERKEYWKKLLLENKACCVEFFDHSQPIESIKEVVE